jgi:hypothetical protein
VVIYIDPFLSNIPKAPLTGTVEEFQGLMKEVPQTKVLVIKPGETIQ